MLDIRVKYIVIEKVLIYNDYCKSKDIIGKNAII